MENVRTKDNANGRSNSQATEGANQPGGEAGAGRPRINSFTKSAPAFRAFLFFVFLVAVDQATKYFAYHSQFGIFLNSLKPVFAKLLFPNYNFAFSLRVGTAWTYAIYFVLLIVLGIWFSFAKNRSAKMVAAFVLIFAGALSNIYDRVTLGYVRDFIFVFWGNIFNLADLYIVTGIILLVANN